MHDPRLIDEAARQIALERYDVLDSPPERAFERITQLVRNILGVPMAAVSLIDKDRQWFKSHDGIDTDETARNVAFCDHTIQQRAPFVVPDARADARFSANPLVTDGPHIRSYAGVPLTTPDGYNIGSLCALDTAPRDYEPGQLEILRNLADLVIEQLELRRIAERDHLTGALTRRAFIVEMDRSIALYGRYGRPASLLLFDIDRFKAINDEHGHPAGDRVIRAVVDLCVGHMRPSDMIGRVGGEEFAILMPETEAPAAATAAERLRAALSDLEIAHVPPLRATASFGVAGLGPSLPSSDAWLAAADAALYAAKRGGRDRVELAKGEPVPV